MDIQVIKTQHSRIGEIHFENLGIWEVFSDHMFSMEYKNNEWTSPQIIPFGRHRDIPLLCSLHYGQGVFFKRSKRHSTEKKGSMYSARKNIMSG